MNQIAQIVKDSAPPAGAAIVTVGSGYAILFTYIPIVFSCFAALTGGILSIVLTIKTWHNIMQKKEEREYKKELRKEIEKRRSEGLECQRCIDFEILKELNET
jgi:hypothetical protein